MHILLKHKPLFNNIAIFLVLFLTIFAEPSNFSLFTYNFTPVRLLAPLLSLFLIFQNFNNGFFKNKEFITLNLLYIIFLFSISLSLPYSADINTGLGIVFFWISAYLFLLAVYVSKESIKEFVLIPHFLIIGFLLFIGFIYRYSQFSSGFMNIFYPGFFIEDGNHMAFIISIILIFLLILILQTKKYVFKLFLYLLAFIFAVTLISCDGLGANLLVFLNTVFLGIFVFFIRKKAIWSILLFSISIFFGFLIWNLLPKSLNMQSPFFIEEKKLSIAKYTTNNNVNPVLNTENSPVSAVSAVSENIIYIKNPNFHYPNQVFSIYSNFKYLPASVFAHATLIYSSVILFLNKPIAGWGLGSFNESMMTTGLHSFFTFFDPSASSVSNYPAHTMYGNYLAEAGILGFTGYMFLFGYLFYLVIKKYKSVPSENFNLKITYFGYILTYLAYFLFTLIYNLHEEFIILPMILMALGESSKKPNYSKMFKNFKSTLTKYVPIFNKYMLFLMILTSFILEHRLLPINPNLNYIRYTMVLFILGNIVYLFLKNKKIIYDKLFYILLFFGLFKLSSILYSVSKIDTIINSFYWLGIALLYLILKNYTFLSTKKDLKALIIVACVVSSFFSYLQIFFFYFFNLKLLNFYGWIHPFGFRVTGLSFDANHLAAFTLLGIFISLYYLITIKALKYKVLNLGLLLYFLPVFYFSSSRSALIGVFFGFFIFILWFILKYDWFTKFAKIYLVLIPVIFVSVFLFFYPSLSLKEKGGDLGVINEIIYNLTKNVVIHGRGLDGSAFAHFSLVYSSFYLADDNYFLGAGSGNFDQGIYADKRLSGIFDSLDPKAFSGGNFPAHSMYGEALGEGGIIGIILFCTILIFIVNRYLQILKYDKSVFPFFIYFYSILFFMLFYNINEEFFWLFTFLGLSLANKPVLNEGYKSN